jgi:3',5'-cyclic AMP phosphodiesterase CpdA
MDVILHLSDTHFGTEQPEVAQALIELTHQLQPDLTIISGDITQRAKAKQFSAADAFCKALYNSPRVVIAGNHDIPLFNLPMRFSCPYYNFQKTFGENLEPVFESDMVLVVTVKSTRRYRHIDGELSTAQIDRVCRRLQQGKSSQLRIVVAHHPVYVSTAMDEVNVVKGRDRAIFRWAKAGADLILGGHIHLPFIIPLHSRIAEVNYPLWVIQAGTAVSERVRRNAPNSVNIIRYYDSPDEPRHCKVEQWNYIVQQAIFSCVANETLPLSPATF